MSSYYLIIGIGDAHTTSWIVLGSVISSSIVFETSPLLEVGNVTFGKFRSEIESNQQIVRIILFDSKYWN